jgi:hypothetical protein
LGKGNEALSSRAAVAEGGITGENSAVWKTNLDEALTTTVGGFEQGMKTGRRYARLGAAACHIFSVIPGCARLAQARNP